MRLHRPAIVVALLLAATAALSACTVTEPITASTPTPTPTIVDTTQYIGGVVNPAGSVWIGKDSGGDATTLTLHKDGTVAVAYGANSYDDPNDTWKVTDGVLSVSVYLDPTNGSAQYTGNWNTAAASIDAAMTTTVSKRYLTVTLVQQ